MRNDAAAAAQNYFRARLVASLYRLLLGRAPDAAGFASALRALRRKQPLAGIIAAMLDAAEFRRRHPAPVTTPADIDALFRAAFGHGPPALDQAAAAPAAYAAQLLETAERQAPSKLTSALYPGGFNPDDAPAYRFWLADHDSPDAAAGAAMARAAAALPPGPALSLLLLPGTAGARAIAACLASLRAQSCDRFELIVAGPPAACAQARRAWPAAVTLPLDKADEAAAFNHALPHCRGAFLWRISPAVRLAPVAVFHAASAIAADPGIIALFSDHDQVRPDGARFGPVFWSGWDPEAAHAAPALLPDMILRTGAVRAAGGLRPGPCAAADLAWRVVDGAAGQVRHIQRPLFSIAAPASWLDRRRARRAAAARAPAWHQLVAARAAPARVEDAGGLLRIRHVLPARPPLVSIIIPTRDRADLLRACIEGLRQRTDYQPLEIIVIDHDSQEPASRAYLAELAGAPNLRLLRWQGAFNWGAINNFGARAANGEILLFLNNDTAVLHPDWLTELASQAMRPEVGAVGGKLLYPDGSVQHAGLVLGPQAQALHRFRHLPGNAAGYRDALLTVRGVAALTGACLAMRRAVYEEAGGIEQQDLAVTWSDLDLCLRVRALGYRVIITPFARLLHVELATRGADDTPEKSERAAREAATMLRRWPCLAEEDPFFNRNFQLGEGDTRLTGTPRGGLF
jgi:GT2 family glycosyltransferase